MVMFSDVIFRTGVRICFVYCCPVAGEAMTSVYKYLHHFETYMFVLLVKLLVFTLVHRCDFRSLCSEYVRSLDSTAFV